LEKETHSAKFLQEMRELLLEKRGAIVANIRGGQENLTAGEGHHLADIEDLASDAGADLTTHEILELAQQDLAQVDRAIAALEGGSYGLCERCGESVGKPRLRALPFATHCIECKRALERGDPDDDDDA